MICLNIYPRFIIPHIRGYFSSFCFLFPRISNSTLRKDRQYILRVNIDKTIISQQIPVHVQVPTAKRTYLPTMYRYCLYVRTGTVQYYIHTYYTLYRYVLGTALYGTFVPLFIIIVRYKYASFANTRQVRNFQKN